MPQKDVATTKLTAQLGHLLHRAAQVCDGAFAAKAEDLGGLTPRQYAVLTTVEEAKTPLSQTEIMYGTGIDRSTLSGIIRRLLKSGLLQRRRSKVDTRVQSVSLTSAGRAALDTGMPAAVAGDVLAVEALGAERVRLLVQMLEEFIGYAGTPAEEE